MPSGPVGYSTAANATSNILTDQIAVPNANLVQGTNVLAVEVHQASGGPNDLLFDAELIGVSTPPERRTLVFNEHAAPGADFWNELENERGREVYTDGVRNVHGWAV